MIESGYMGLNSNWMLDQVTLVILVDTQTVPVLTAEKAFTSNGVHTDQTCAQVQSVFCCHLLVTCDFSAFFFVSNIARCNCATVVLNPLEW